MSQIPALLAQAAKRRFAFSKRMNPLEWAEQVYRLPGGGRFRWSYAPYTRGIFLSYFERENIETVLMMYSRGLKSTTALLYLGYRIDQDPCRILNLWPTNDQAELFCKEILTGELFDTTPSLNYLGSAGKKRTGQNTIRNKKFPGGLFTAFGANTPGDMRRAKGQVMYAEEIDAIGSEATDEGDQLAIFHKRGDEFSRSIKVTASYPSVKGRSRIAARMSKTDGNQWLSTCVRCGGEPFVMHRSMLRYDKNDLRTARMECPWCKELLTDVERYSMAHEQGFDNWRPQREFTGRRGFHANAMLWPHPVDPVKYPGGFLQLLAQQEQDADNAENPKRARRVLVNTVDAETYDPTEDTEKPPEWRELFNRREEYTVAPKPAVVLTAMVDVQNNRLEVEWRAWARDDQSWGMAHTVLDGNTRDHDVWRVSLARELQRKFKHESGAELGLSLAFIDGGWAGEWVYDFTRWLHQNPIAGVTGKVRATKGIGQAGHPIIDRNWRTIAKMLKGYHIGTWEAKDTINQRLLLKKNEDGTFPARYMHLPQSYGEIYFQQLCTGIPTIEYEGGQEVKKFLNKDHLRDEALDLAVGNLAAFRMRHWNFDALEAQIAEEAERLKPKPELPEDPTDPIPNFTPQNSFVGARGWRI